MQFTRLEIGVVDVINVEIDRNFIILGYRRAKPLGMENYEITETQLTVSSYHQAGWLKGRGRLNFQRRNQGAWMPAGSDIERWFQVDFILIATVVQIWTQGFMRYGTEHLYTKTYEVHYGYDSVFFQAYSEGGATKVMIPLINISSV